jgi:hypothetical protein
VKPGEEQHCPRCGEWHVLEQKRADSRVPYELSMLFVTCRGQLYFAGNIDRPSPYPTRQPSR